MSRGNVFEATKATRDKAAAVQLQAGELCSPRGGEGFVLLSDTGLVGKAATERLGRSASGNVVDTRLKRLSTRCTRGHRCRIVGPGLARRHDDVNG